ncbi:hypothetical protein KFL_012230010 [Klebsormidium nitens]|uniref:Uncharacterized protein n=1 Tax=Klebsormidium nitens TaxID=105231 RepID=A0A1Y1IW52_KLENI|nr:hypothetical protein KFL_012230010 [Klebsormidium nitens]|eukprot:GAQ92957.1 hypothetical protein KFL_012230010 [Klebsormidium nitens]
MAAGAAPESVMALAAQVPNAQNGSAEQGHNQHQRDPPQQNNEQQGAQGANAKDESYSPSEQIDSEDESEAESELPKPTSEGSGSDSQSNLPPGPPSTEHEDEPHAGPETSKELEELLRFYLNAPESTPSYVLSNRIGRVLCVIQRRIPHGDTDKNAGKVDRKIIAINPNFYVMTDKASADRLIALIDKAERLEREWEANGGKQHARSSRKRHRDSVLN